MNPIRPLLITLAALHGLEARAQTDAPSPAADAAASVQTPAGSQASPDAASPARAGATPAGGPESDLGTIVVRSSADASARGLSRAYAGGQVARGGRVGLFGTRDAMSTPFSSTSYTNELIQDRQAHSVGEVLQNDPGVRVARGFGNFQEAYFIRGFVLNSDDVAYNGLYSLLPRQYIATELFERVEVLRGASAFLNGTAPGGSGIGGAINLLPKRAPNEPLSRVTVGLGSGFQKQVGVDLARRFGPDGSTGIRLNAALRQGGTAVHDERAKLGMLAAGFDWRSARARLSADLGWQDNRLRRTRPNVTLGSGLTAVPQPPEPADNFAQPWSYSNERDLFGTFRGEYDVNDAVTLWGAWGIRRSHEANSLANPTVTDVLSGAATTYRFDNTRKDHVDTGEAGLRGRAVTGPVAHEWVVSGSMFRNERRNAYAMSAFGGMTTNLYSPVAQTAPGFTLTGNDLGAPALTGRTTLVSFAAGDTMSMFGDRLQLIAGLRHQRIEVRNYAYNTGVEGDPYDRSRTSPVAGIVWKFSPQVSVYANYIEGLTQGETAPSVAANVGQMLAPYVSRQQEIGVKVDTGRLRTSLAAFQTRRPRAFLDANNVFGTSGQDRHRGLEWTVHGEPVRGVRVLGGLTWLQATQVSTGTPALDGNRVIGVPRWMGNLGAEWEIPNGSGVALDTRVVYTGASQANAANTLRVPGWTRVDVGARWLTNLFGRDVTLRARVDNVTNRRYWGSVGGSPGYGYLTVAAPRTFMASASVDF